MLALILSGSYSTLMPFYREMYGSFSCASSRDGLTARFNWEMEEEYAMPVRHFTFYIGRPAILFAGFVTVHHHPKMSGLPESVSHIKLPMFGKDDLSALSAFVGVEAVRHLQEMKGSEEIMFEEPVTLSSKEVRGMERREARLRAKRQPDIPKPSGVAVLNQLLSNGRRSDR
jgi:hypothetical protein